MVPAYKPWIIEQGNHSMRGEEAQGLDGLMAKMTACERKETADWLANVSCCFLTVCPFIPFPPSSFVSFLHLVYLHFLLTISSPLLMPLLHSHLSNFCLISPLPSPNLQPNALLSLNVLFLLASCLHPSQWPRVTPGRIITLGQKIGSVAPCSALSALSIYGLSPFVVSHLPIVQ